MLICWLLSIIWILMRKLMFVGILLLWWLFLKVHLEGFNVLVLLHNRLSFKSIFIQVNFLFWFFTLRDIWALIWKCTFVIIFLLKFIFMCSWTIRYVNIGKFRVQQIQVNITCVPFLIPYFRHLMPFKSSSLVVLLCLIEVISCFLFFGGIMNTSLFFLLNVLLHITDAEISHRIIVDF